MPAQFDLGRTLITPGALSGVEPESVQSALVRHGSGDWGDLDREDWVANDRALKDGTRLLSAYCDGKGVKFWIITEWDRSATTILLPEEY